jgi:glucose-1-phosphate adenylyltransferase
MILAGGQGDRLSVLSEERAKPAVVFGGRYRIIDFALSNCINSEITRVAVLAQYRPRSLVDHIGSGRPWDLDRTSGGGIHILQPYLGRESSDWYRGTADAVFQNVSYVEEQRADLVLILAGDHVYKMNYDAMLNFHLDMEADCTVALSEVPIEEASRFGIVTIDTSGRVVDFEEKPSAPKSNLISMGIYAFNREFLKDQLIADAQDDNSMHDFGRDIIPKAFPHARVFGYPFRGYWRDVGTIQSYFDANMDLVVDLPELNLYDRDTLIRTRSTGLPPVKIGSRAYVNRSLLNLGCIINGHVEHSILSPGVYVEEGAIIRNSVIFDDTHVEAGAVIENSILDKEIRVGRRAHIGFGEDSTPNRERPDIVNTGITVIGKRAVIPAEIRIGHNVVIGPGVAASDFVIDHIPSGSTYRAQRQQALLPGFTDL